MGEFVTGGRSCISFILLAFTSWTVINARSSKKRAITALKPAEGTMTTTEGPLCKLRLVQQVLNLMRGLCIFYLQAPLWSQAMHLVQKHTTSGKISGKTFLSLLCFLYKAGVMKLDVAIFVSFDNLWASAWRTDATEEGSQAQAHRFRNERAMTCGLGFLKDFI